MKTFRSYELAKAFYRLVQKLKLAHHLYTQLARAALSVACNLAEGNGRPTWPDRRRFFYQAFASIKECQAVLDLADVTDELILETADHLAASIYRLCRSQKN